MATKPTQVSQEVVVQVVEAPKAEYVLLYFNHGQGDIVHNPKHCRMEMSSWQISLLQ